MWTWPRTPCSDSKWMPSRSRPRLSMSSTWIMLVIRVRCWSAWIRSMITSADATLLLNSNLVTYPWRYPTKTRLQSRKAQWSKTKPAPTYVSSTSATIRKDDLDSPNSSRKSQISSNQNSINSNRVTSMVSMLRIWMFARRTTSTKIERWKD